MEISVQMGEFDRTFGVNPLTSFADGHKLVMKDPVMIPVSASITSPLISEYPVSEVPSHSEMSLGQASELPLLPDPGPPSLGPLDSPVESPEPRPVQVAQQLAAAASGHPDSAKMFASAAQLSPLGPVQSGSSTHALGSQLSEGASVAGASVSAAAASSAAHMAQQLVKSELFAQTRPCVKKASYISAHVFPRLLAKVGSSTQASESSVVSTTGASVSTTGASVSTAGASVSTFCPQS